MAYYDDPFLFQATGAAGSASVLASKTVAGGTVAAGNALRLTCGFLATTGFSFKVKLNGVTLYDTGAMPIIPVFFDLLIVRDGGSGAHVVALLQGDSAVGYMAPQRAYKTGLSWASGQTIEVVGTSDGVGGLTLQWGGLIR